jgi:hypothetical protein
MKRSTNPHPKSADEGNRKEIWHPSRDERVALLRFVKSRLPDDDPLKCRIDTAIEVMTQRPADFVDEAIAEEVKSTEVAAWRAIEAQKEISPEEPARIGDEYRNLRLSRFEQLVSLNSGDPGQWSEFEDAFKVDHQENPGLVAWVHINESPAPVGPGSLQFRELGNQAAAVVAGVKGDEAWKCWLEVVVGHLLRNDTREEYIHTMKVHHLARPQGSTVQTHRGVIIDGESYRIDHVSKASELCCSWLPRTHGPQGGHPECTAGEDTRGQHVRRHRGIGWLLLRMGTSAPD